MPGLAEAETPSCSGLGLREGLGRTRVAAAAAVAAAGMLWLVDSHYSVGSETNPQINGTFLGILNFSQINYINNSRK